MHINSIRVLLIFLVISSSLLAQEFQLNGQTIESLAFHSKIMKRDIEYSVYLPPDYGKTDDTYPVLYALHSFGNTHSEYIKGIQLHQLADKLVSQGSIQPFIIVTPDAWNTWYLNSYNHEVRYEDMFFEEFLPLIETHYQTNTHKGGRALLGFSMGGSGSFLYAMKHPDQFATAVGYCAGFSTKMQIIADRDTDYKIYHHSLYGANLKSHNRVNAHFLDNNPLYLAKKLPAEQLRSVKWFISTADLDFHSIGNAELHITFRERNIPHEFRVTDGDHTYEHVEAVLEASLIFIGETFNK